MKYLKFYEAFSSAGISSTIKFLRDKINAQAADKFLMTLKRFMSEVDFPIDKISDGDIKYMSSQKAIKLVPDKKVPNSRGIWVIKFWFSLEKGLVGFTSTGNKKSQFKDKKFRQPRSSQSLSGSDLDWISENITETGEMWPVSDYSAFKTGDTILGQYGDSRSKLGLAKIFVDSFDSRVYAIQAVNSGSGISDQGWLNYRQYGDKTWYLCDTEDDGEIGADHSKLHFWRPSDKPISIIQAPVESELEDGVENPLDYNLPLDSNWSPIGWNESSFPGKDSHTDVLESDFSLVLYFDDLLQGDNQQTKPSQLQRQRKEQRSGALKSYTDAEIKKINIERYLKKMSHNIDISEFSNLKKIVNKHLANTFTYISITIKRPDWEDLADFCTLLYKVIDDGDLDYYVKKVKELYQDRSKRHYELMLQFQEQRTYISGDNYLVKIFDKYFETGTLITQYFNKIECSSIDDLFLISRKIMSLYSFMNLSRNRPSRLAGEIIEGFRYLEVESYFLPNKELYTEQIFDQDLIKINRVQDFLKSL